jgi:phage replication O-like protein O
MANPQLENGYTKVANEIFEALAGIRIPGEARQVLDVIFRKTYGFNKKEDKISLSQFCILTHLRDCDVCRAINKLINMNIVSKKANLVANIYRFNKDFTTWKPLAKKQMISNKANLGLQKSKLGLAIKQDTKETITKDNIKEIAKNTFLQGTQWNELIDSFKPLNDLYLDFYSNKTERNALDHLAKTIGTNKLKNAIRFVTDSLGDTYAPTITKPTELKRKYGALQKYYKSNKNKL